MVTLRERWQLRFEQAMTAESTERVAKLFSLRNDISDLRESLVRAGHNYPTDFDNWFDNVCAAFQASLEV